MRKGGPQLAARPRESRDPEFSALPQLDSRLRGNERRLIVARHRLGQAVIVLAGIAQPVLVRLAFGFAFDRAGDVRLAGMLRGVARACALGDDFAENRGWLA